MSTGIQKSENQRGQTKKVMPHELGLSHTALNLFYIKEKALHSLHLHLSNGYRPAISRYLNNRNTRHGRLNVLNRR